MEKDNDILSPDKLNSMMVISKKGISVTVIILLVITLFIYFLLFLGRVEETYAKKVYFDGSLDKESIAAYMARPENGGFSPEDTLYQLYNIWDFDKDKEQYGLLSTVLSRREYDRYAPVLGAKVIIPGEVCGYVVYIQNISEYEDLYAFGFTDTDLKQMNIYPGEDIYYLLNIISDDYTYELAHQYWDGIIIFRSTSLRKLLDGPNVEGKN